MRWDAVLEFLKLLNVGCADKLRIFFGMGCQKELDRHVIIPPKIFARWGFDVYLICGFPEEESLIDRKIKSLISSTPFAWH